MQNEGPIEVSPPESSRGPEQGPIEKPLDIGGPPAAVTTLNLRPLHAG